MRVAAVVPSLPPRDPVRESIDAVVDRIAREVEVERFGEADRCRDDAGVSHYLKLPARHGQLPFDNAFYPLGRDHRTWEAAFLCGERLRGVTWVVDPAPGHMAVAAMALRDRWDAYHDGLAAEFGDRVAGNALSTLAGGWADRAFHRRFDLLVPMLREQRAVAWRDGTRPEDVGGREVPLPTPASEPVPRKGTDVLVLSSNGRWPEPVLRGLRHHARAGSATVTFCHPSPFARRVRRAVAAAGLDRVTCLPSPTGAELRDLLGRAAFVVLLEPEATVLEMALLQEAMALEACVIVPEAPRFDGFPPQAVVRVPLGAGLGTALEVCLAALSADRELRAAIGREARAFARSRTVDAVAASLLECLRATAGPRECLRPAAVVWERLAGDLVRRAAPRSTPPAELERLATGVAGLLPDPGRRS